MQGLWKPPFICPTATSPCNVFLARTEAVSSSGPDEAGWGVSAIQGLQEKV